MSEPGLDALLPAEMARKAEEVGVKKASLPWDTTFTLAVLAGAFIALGSMSSSTAMAGASGILPWGLTRVIGGIVFSLGLILVIVGGAELFTGNNLLVMAWMGRKLPVHRLLRNWAIVYAGNFVGAVATAGLIFVSGQYALGKGAVGATVLAAAEGKCELTFVPAIALGTLCNALVCLAVWLTYSARTTADRVIAIVPPISAFVAAGFEHSIANMYAVPLAIFIKEWAPESFWQAVGLSPGAYPMVDWRSFLIAKLLPVTVGNIIGGVVLVGATYWFVYLRRSR